ATSTATSDPTGQPTRSRQRGRVSGSSGGNGGHQPGVGDQRRRDHEQLVLPAGLHGDHVQLRQHPDGGVVGKQSGSHRGGGGVRAALGTRREQTARTGSGASTRGGPRGKRPARP